MISLDRLHLTISMTAEMMSLTMSCADAELWCWWLSEPYLITMKADQCLSWFFEHSICHESHRMMWLWALDCWAPQLLMLMIWSWSLLTWEWGLIVMVLLIPSLSQLGTNLMTLMPVDQDLRDEVKWPLFRRKMPAWPWTPWCYVSTPSLDQVMSERTLTKDEDDTAAYAHECAHWGELRGDEWWMRVSHSQIDLILTPIHSRGRELTWTHLDLHLIQEVVWMTAWSESRPWNLKAWGDQVLADEEWGIWSLQDSLPGIAEDDLWPWSLTRLCRRWWCLLMMLVIHDGCSEPQWGRSCDTSSLEDSRRVSNWVGDLTPWHEEPEAHDAADRAWTLHHWGWPNSADPLSPWTSWSQMTHVLSWSLMRSAWHPLTNDTRPSSAMAMKPWQHTWPMSQVLSDHWSWGLIDIAISILTWAASSASWSWLLTIKIGHSDSVITSSWAWGWSADAAAAASWAALNADATAMISEVSGFNEASDASEADSSALSLSRRRRQWQRAEHLTSEQMIDLMHEENWTRIWQNEWIEQAIWHDSWYLKIMMW